MAMSELEAELKDLKPGQEVFIETSTELLNGPIKSINIALQMIEIDGACDLKSGYVHENAQVLAFSDIVTLRIKPVGNDTSIASINTTAAIVEQEVCPEESAETAPLALSKPLVSVDLQQVQEHLSNIIYITKLNQKYHNALIDINRQSIIALLVEPLKFERAFIAVATYQTVYIFDIMALGGISTKLKQFLKAKRPIKALHFGNVITDYLKRMQVDLHGFFDTFVAYCFVNRTKYLIDLIKMIQTIFDVPQSYFQLDQNNEDDESDISVTRLLTSNQIQLIAKIAIFQLKLYDHLLHERMLDNFNHQCIKFSQVFNELGASTNVLVKINSESTFGFQHIHRNGSLMRMLSSQPFEKVPMETLHQNND